MTESQLEELADLIRGLNWHLMTVAQEVADLRADLHDLAAKLAAVAAIVGGAQ